MNSYEFSGKDVRKQHSSCELIMYRCGVNRLAELRPIHPATVRLGEGNEVRNK